MTDDLRTTLEVSRLLGAREWAIRHQLRAGRVRRPSTVVSGNFLWRPAEVRDLARALGVPVPAKVSAVQCPAARIDDRQER